MTEMVRYQEAPMSFAETMTLGKTLAESGFFQDSRGAAQAVTKIMAGRELGIPAIAAMTGIHVIKGKIAVGANLIAAKIKSSGKYTYRVREMSDKVCSIEFFEKGESIGVSTFTIEDARKADTQNLGKFPRNMLFARAMSNGAKWFTPDIFIGPIYTPEELGASVDDEETVTVVQVESTTPAFDASAARAAILALPQATALDAATVEQLDDPDDLRALYKEVKSRKQTEEMPETQDDNE